MVFLLSSSAEDRRVFTEQQIYLQRKFALRKQRRKVKSELANKNKHLKEATAPTSFVFDDCSTVDPMSFVMDECLNYDDDCLK